ncbi:DMT family transporter [Notoacmeibacter ruber]|uniref:DMT family transporter n=1 Tax=Notoacmeibacter ruber TaxID=2670375 RepID=A0A3L7J8L5_9HYPH|nr:DMT family transporter [Notoacmeibacter ruber]RLQ87078.1 DMT family transporter [Notoacmeibacter ruber]
MTRYFSNIDSAITGPALIIIAGAFFALTNTLLQYGAMVQGIPPARLTFWQYLIAFCFMIPWIVARGRAALRTGHAVMHVLRVATAVGGVQLWTMGLAHVPIWQAIALIMLSPFFVTLGAHFLLKEETTIERWAALTLGFGGGMIILAPLSEDFSAYALYPVCAAALWAASSLFTKRMTRTESAETLTVYLLLLLTPFNALIALDVGLAVDLETGGLLLFGAGLLTALAQYALAKAYSLSDAAYLQPFDHVKLPLNVGLGLAVFGFMPPGSMWIGSALIVGASWFLLQREAKLDALQTDQEPA